MESAYQFCLTLELKNRNLLVETEVDQPIVYEGVLLTTGYRLDMLVENCVIIENKAIEKLLPIHQAQLLTYLRLRNLHLGYLINWHVPLIKDGINRMVHKL